MNQIFFLLMIIYSCCMNIFGQVAKRPVNGITLGYFNDKFGSPGSRLGYEYDFYEKQRQNITSINIQHGFVLKANINFFNHKRSDVGVVVNISCGYRYISKAGLIIEPFHVGGGGMYSFLNGKTYQVDASGQISEKIRGYGTWVFPYLQLIGLGYDFRQKGIFPMSFMASIDPYFQRNVNTRPQLRLATPISFTYYFQ